MIIVKVGGGEGVDTESVVKDVAELVKQGEQVVLVHGGSHETNVISEKLGHPPHFVTSISGHSSRYTDRETLEIFMMVTAGKINKLIVEQLQQLGVNAVGLSGIDGRLLEGKRKSFLRIKEGGKRKILRGEYSGVIETVNGDLLTTLLDAGYTPVIAPQAISYESEALNVDGDRAAAAIAAELNAETLVILTNVPGPPALFRFAVHTVKSVLPGSFPVCLPTDQTRRSAAPPISSDDHMLPAVFFLWQRPPLPHASFRSAVPLSAPTASFPGGYRQKHSMVSR